jgi:O-antigen/teichoic acid export membrane protein
MISTVTKKLKLTLVRVLRWSERYTKTDMVYLAQAGIWNNLSVILSSVFGLILSVSFANLLPKEVYGTYQYLLSLSALVAAICLGGMQHAVAQSVARGNEGDLRVSLTAQLKWNLVPTSLGLLGAVYYAIHSNYSTALALVFIAIFTPLVSAFSIYGAFLGGTRQFKRIFLYSLLTNVTYYVAIFIAMLFFKNAVVLIFVNLGVNAVAVIYLYYRTLKVHVPTTQTDPTTVAYGAHLSVMNAFGTTISQLDSILVFHFLGAANLAIYSFATLIPERVSALLGFVGSAAYPKYSQKTLPEIQKSIIPQTIRAAALGGAITLLYIIFSPLLFHILFPKYAESIHYTQFYSPVILLMTANLVSLALTAQRRKMDLYITSFLNPVMLIALQIPLLLLYGIWGMILARLVTDALGIILGIFLLLRKNTSYGVLNILKRKINTE